jgi:hypothetical protein
MILSITLPSLHREQLVSVVENITWTTRERPEIIVVSPFQPFEVPGSRIVWVREDEPAGISAAHAAAFAAATGEFVFAWTDDHYVHDGWDDILLGEFRQREKEIPTEIFSLGPRFVAPHNNVETIFGRYYPCFPLMRRQTVERIGGWLSPDFKVGFSDPDLGMRVWEHGGRCEWSTARMLRPSQNNVRYPGDGFEMKFRIDAALLVRKWFHMASDRWDLSDTSKYNVGIDLGEACLGRTICCSNGEEFWRKYRGDQIQLLQP